MKIFVINLDKDKKKLIDITKNLNKYNLKFEKFSAIEGNKIITKKGDSFLKKFINDSYLKFVSPGAIGCFLSHFCLWKRIIKFNLDNILILEDDAEFLGDKKYVIDTLNDLYKNFPKMYDIIYLNCGGLCGDNCNNLFGNICNKYDNLLNIPLWSSGTYAYIISNNGARKLINSLIPLDMDFDAKIGYLIKMQKINGYSLSKLILKHQKKELSNIIGMRKPMLNKISYLLFLNEPVYKLPFPYPINFYIDIYSLTLIILAILLGFTNKINPLYLLFALLFLNWADFIFMKISLKEKRYTYHTIFDTFVPIFIYLFIRNIIYCKKCSD